MKIINNRSADRCVVCMRNKQAESLIVCKSCSRSNKRTIDICMAYWEWACTRTNGTRTPKHAWVKYIDGKIDGDDYYNSTI